MRISRRSLLLAGAGAAAAAALPRSLAAQPARRAADTIVVGAGVFGAWTAKRLQEAGQRVLLLDAWGPAHARASSGGESRMIRAGYGADAVYTSMAWESLDVWRSLSAR
ncbi:MAG TPA: FAD-dependent oxidoreductase, partial [Solirubrobacterales bacterium]|nr:FAD-dependent oxidoreductase [Solirubrobacterales bacterium]